MTNAPLWAGDVRPAPRELLREFSDSTADDVVLWRHDLLGSLAHVAVLEDAGLVTPAEAAELRRGLRRLLQEAPALDPALEDVHMNAEARLTALTPAGAKLHTARSRNDQVALDLRLYAREQLGLLALATLDYVERLLAAAERHVADTLPGRTHLQPGQPVTLGHHLHAHATRALRDLARIDAAWRATNVSPLGAGALAGTTLGTNPATAARALGFDATFANSLDAVSDRDFALDALHAAAALGVHLSSLGEELVLWATPEFGYVDLAPDLTTGSSLMPQKRNPDGAELLRSSGAALAADWHAVASISRSLPLAYNRDLQDAKGPLLRGLRRSVLAARMAAALVEGARFRTDRMAAGLFRGHPEATDLADALVRAGRPFREAHHEVARLVKEADERGVPLRDVAAARGLPAVEPDPSAKTTPGGPAPKAVVTALAHSRSTMNDIRSLWSARLSTVLAAEKALEESA